MRANFSILSCYPYIWGRSGSRYLIMHWNEFYPLSEEAFSDIEDFVVIKDEDDRNWLILDQNYHLMVHLDGFLSFQQ